MSEIGEVPIPEENHRETNVVKRAIKEKLSGTYEKTSKEYLDAFKRVQQALPKGSLPRNIVDRLDRVARVGAAVGGGTAQVKDTLWSIGRMALHVHPAVGFALHFVPGDIFSAPERSGVRAGSKAAEFIAHRVYGGEKRKDAIVKGIANGFNEGPRALEANKVLVGTGRP